MPGVGVIILAAGGSTRLGRPKQLLSYRGNTLIRHAAKTALSSICHSVTVVLGPQADKLESQLKDLPVTSVLNPDWELGLSSSIRAGLAALDEDEDMDAVILMLCDQPLVSPYLLNHFLRLQEWTRCGIVASDYGQTLGVPALFTRKYFPDLMALSGTEGSKRIIHRHLEDTQTVPFPEGSFDVDTEQDYQQVLRQLPDSIANPLQLCQI